MKNLRKYIGVIIILIAILILIFPALIGEPISSNTLLIVVVLLLIIGVIAHIFCNKRF